MSRQYVVVRFSPGDKRTYTYHNDGEPVRKGDRVDVPTPRGQLTVEVEMISGKRPPFQTKEIIGRPAPPAQGGLGL